MSCQDPLLNCRLTYTWYFIHDVLHVSLSEVSFIFGVLLKDLSKSPRFEISLVLTADDELPKMIFFILVVSLIGL